MMDIDLTHCPPSQPIASGSGSGSAPAAQLDFSFDMLTNLEQHFYDAGHADGYAHGRIHGLIEGRQLGREKGFELWEEVGYYEGFARFWKAVLVESERAHAVEGAQQSSRALHHITTLFALIARFPSTNPSSAEHDPPQPIATHLPTPPPEEVDISALLAQIRARYRALCASLGVKPRMAVAQARGGGAGATESGPRLGRSLGF